ncbi:MAG: fluoride efflux transporter CrcB [Gemmatimonadota bacterium]|nr:fluoride efflux transporter CrcB [Gemmatimonadota bacterium]
MTKVLLVGLGGFVGSSARYVVGVASARLWPAAGLQLGTLIVNVAGCLLIGILAAYADARAMVSPELRALVLIGMLGGFTTFSTFAFETLELGRAGGSGVAAMNVMLHVIGCLAAVWLGSAIGRALAGA